MKQASTVSPFAQLSKREQKEKWICWQAQQEKHTSACERSVQLPPLRLPVVHQTDDGRDEAKQTEVSYKQTEVSFPAPVRHGQYSAVISKMKAAQKQAGAYTSWSSSSTQQAASGSPKAEK